MRRWLILFTALLAAPAHAVWWEASTPHFVVYGEGSEANLRDFASRLERFDATLRMLRGIEADDPGPTNRLTVYIPGDTGDIGKLARTSNAAGFYISRAGRSVAFVPRTTSTNFQEERQLTGLIVLLHEYSHHFMMIHYPAAYPAWFREGYAEFNSTTRFEKNGSIGFGIPAQHRAYALSGPPALPIRTMLASDYKKLSHSEMSGLYGWGWLLTHYLMFEKSREGQLSTYLRALNSGKGGLEAAQTAFGDIGQLEKDLNRYRRQATMPYLNLPPNSVRIGEVKMRRVEGGEAALMDLRVRSDRGVGLKEAQGLIASARRAAAPYPSEPTAQCWLAEMEHDARNWSEAEAAADRALAAKPDSHCALIYKGRTQVARLEEAKSKDAEAWKKARRWFVQANKADPQDPLALILFFTSFHAAGAEPTANAKEGLLYAQEQAPHDRGVRWMAGRLLVADGKLKEARRVLAPLAYDPHGGSSGARVMSALTALDKDDGKAALAALDGQSEAAE